MKRRNFIVGAAAIPAIAMLPVSANSSNLYQLAGEKAVMCLYHEGNWAKACTMYEAKRLHSVHEQLVDGKLTTVAIFNKNLYTDDLYTTVPPLFVHTSYKMIDLETLTVLKDRFTGYTGPMDIPDYVDRNKILTNRME